MLDAYVFESIAEVSCEHLGLTVSSGDEVRLFVGQGGRLITAVGAVPGGHIEGLSDVRSAQ